MGFNNFKETVVATSTTWAALVARNNARTALVLFNQGTVDVYFGITEAGMITIPAGKGVSFNEEDSPQNALGCKSASGTPNIVVWEA